MPRDFEVRVNVRATSRLQANITRLGALGPAVLARAVNDLADDLQHDAMDLVPVQNFSEGGVLRRSAFVQHAQPSMRPRAVVGFGARYAEPVHENPRAGRTGGVSPSGRRYKHWAEVGQWHFLEQPFVQLGRRFSGELSRRIRREWSDLMR